MTSSAGLTPTAVATLMIAEGVFTPQFFRLFVGAGHEENLDFYNVSAFFRSKTQPKIFSFFFTKPLTNRPPCGNILVERNNLTQQQKGEMNYEYFD